MAQKAWTKGRIIFTLLQFSSSVFAGLRNTTNKYSMEQPQNCAVLCKESGHNPANWSVVPAAIYFEKCDRVPTLFAYDLEDQSPIAVRACMNSDDEGAPDEDLAMVETQSKDVFCALPAGYDVEVSYKPVENSATIVPGQVIGAGMAINGSLFQKSPQTITRTGGGVVVHGSWADAVMGVYVGSDFDTVDFAHGALEDFIQGVEEHSIGKTLQTQHCGANRTAFSIFGIIADTSSGIEALSTVRKAVKAWSEGKCAETLGRRPVVSQMAVSNWASWSNGAAKTKMKTQMETKTNRTSSVLRWAEMSQLYSAGDCRTREVVSGDSCGALANKCGIPGPKFMEYNPNSNLCAGLMPGQLVCCSPGPLPDLRPKRLPSGDCATYDVAPETANCGVALVNNRNPPKQFLNVGYFEAWNQQQRKCLNMDVDDIPSGKYTHIHFAFADITPDYKVSLGQFGDSFAKFRRARGHT